MKAAGSQWRDAISEVIWPLIWDLAQTRTICNALTFFFLLEDQQKIATVWITNYTTMKNLDHPVNMWDTVKTKKARPNLCWSHWVIRLILYFVWLQQRDRKGDSNEGRRRDEKNVGNRRLQTLGELWLQAFVSNLKTKSSGNIKTSFKNNINIFCGLYMAQYYPRHVHNTKKQFSHTPTSMNSFIANKAMKSISKSYRRFSRKMFH